MNENSYEKLHIFLCRLKKIGIEPIVIANLPWVYLIKINDKKVNEKYLANHGFTVGFIGNEGFKFTDLKEIFNLIRKYAK